MSTATITPTRRTRIRTTRTGPTPVSAAERMADLEAALRAVKQEAAAWGKLPGADAWYAAETARVQAELHTVYATAVLAA